VDAAAEDGGVGGGGRREVGGTQLRLDEGVDRVERRRDGGDGLGRVGFRQSSLGGGHEGPVLRVRGALRDPAFERLLLRGRERLVLLRRRHDLLAVGREDAGDDFAPVGLARHDPGEVGTPALQRRVAEVEPVAGLAVFFIRAVAMEAMLGEDRLHLAVEINVCGTGGRKRERGRQGGEGERSGADGRTQGDGHAFDAKVVSSSCLASGSGGAPRLGAVFTLPRAETNFSRSKPS